MCVSMSLILSFLGWKQNYFLLALYALKYNLQLHHLCYQMENMISRLLKSFPGSPAIQVMPQAASFM